MMKELLDQLERLGFYRFMAPALIQAAMNEALQTGYLFSGETQREYNADSEDLAEGGVLDLLGEMKSFLAREGVDIGQATQHCDTDGYSVMINGEEYQMYSQEELETQDIWFLTTIRALSMVNTLLARVGSGERLYYLYCANDTVAVFLTPVMYDTIVASPALALRDKPNSVA